MLCKIGEVEIWRILEINGPFRTPEHLFPNDGEEAREMIARHAPQQLCADTGKLILPIQGFLLRTPDRLVLVDSCVGNHKNNPGHSDWHMRSSDRFMAALRAAGAEPGDVDFVLCTHLHTDHVGWNTRLEDGRWVPTFANARYLIPKADEAHYRNNPSTAFEESVLPIIEAGQAEFVEGPHPLGDHVALVPTPGHTPGHVSVRITSGTAQALITGDAIHTSAQCWRPNWHFVYDTDPQMAAETRYKLLQDVAESGCVVLGSHFALPSVGRVKAVGDGFEWEER